MFSRITASLVRAWHTPRVRRGVLVGLVAFITLVSAVVLAAWTGACAGNTCPSIEGLDQYDPNQAAKVYAADGRLITDLGLERRTVVPLGEMSPYVKAAFIATEDKRFYEHKGIDWLRVFGAVKANVFKLRFAERLASDIPNARLVRIEDSLTFVPEDQPERLAEAITDFIGQTSPAPAAAGAGR